MKYFIKFGIHYGEHGICKVVYKFYKRKQTAGKGYTSFSLLK